MGTKNPYTGQPYRGWTSTKLHLALITMALICGGFVLVERREEIFEWFVLGLIGASGIYSGGNVVEKIRAMRSGGAAAQPEARVDVSFAAAPPQGSNDARP